MQIFKTTDDDGFKVLIQDFSGLEKLIWVPFNRNRRPVYFKILVRKLLGKRFRENFEENFERTNKV